MKVILILLDGHDRNQYHIWSWKESEKKFFLKKDTNKSPFYNQDNHNQSADFELKSHDV